MKCSSLDLRRSVGLILILSSLAGCSSMRDRATTIADKGKNLVDWTEDPKAIAERQPRSLVAIWSESVIHGADQTPTRGLGARIYFYNSNHKTVKAEGELTVYGYDDDVKRDSPEPDRKFVFPADQLEKHYSESEFGPSYSVWVPWDAVGGPQTAVSVIPVFKTAEGEVLVGSQTRNVLPGKKDKTTQGFALKHRREPLHQADIQQTSYDAASRYPVVALPEPEDDTSGEPSVRTSTIEVPASMRRRLMQPGGANLGRGDQSRASTAYDRYQKWLDSRQKRISENTQVTYAQPAATDRDYPMEKDVQDLLRELPSTRLGPPLHPPQASQGGRQVGGPPQWQRPRTTSQRD